MSEFNPPKPTSPDSYPSFNKIKNEFNEMGTNPSNYKAFKPSGSGMDSMKKWLGPKGFKAFQRALCQSITNQMKRDHEKAQKAARKLKASEEGKDPSEVD